MKRNFALAHPLLVAVVPILALWARNFWEVDPRVAGILLGISMAGAAVATALFALVMGSAARGALMASLFVLLFFLYGHAFTLVDCLGWLSAYWQIHALIGSLWILLLIGAFRGLKAKHDWREISLTLSVASAIMVALPVGQMLIRSVSNRTASATENLPEIFEVSNPKPAPPILHDDPGKPDVYYIILDGYGRADVLKNVYGFDNSEFIRQLKDRGFYIAEKGTANYPMTFMSLASSLNLNYLDDVVASTKGCTSQKLFHDVIQNPLAGRVFRSHGYRHVHFATGFRGTEDSKTADLIFSYRSRWIRGEFRDVLVSTTALRLFEPNVAGSHLYEFRKLQEVPRIPGPKFVFAHFLIPHEPYVFTSDGTVRDNVPLGLQFLEKDGTWRIGTGVDRNSYIDQLMFVNRKAIEAIDGILANSRTRPIIILQSDHGPASLRSKGREVFSRERLPNLNAYFVPDTIREKLYSSITPVNSFRIVFNDLFGTSYELLPDRNYMCWFTNIKPIDVTDIVRLGPPEPTLVAQKEKLAQVSGN